MAARTLHRHIGSVFGRLTVTGIEYGKNPKRLSEAYFECVCSCGASASLRANRVIEGTAASCGCLRRNDLVGQQHGRLTVTKFAGADRHNKALYCCTCVCGREVIVVGSSLTSGNTASCGCFRREVWHSTRKHEQKGKEYTAWKAMKQRCHNPNNPSFRDYGGKGVIVSDRWRGDDGFKNFLTDMGTAPSPQHTVDRFPDPYGNYAPNNCRWATALEQNRNKRKPWSGVVTAPVVDPLRHKAYCSWTAMRQRCRNRNHHAFARYGARGIRVCERWDSFEQFLSDIGLPPSTDHTIDRHPNRDGNYEPNNCRWATKKEQAVNRSTTVVLAWGDRHLCLADWARELRIGEGAISYWLKKGKTVEQIAQMEHR